MYTIVLTNICNELNTIIIREVYFYRQLLVDTGVEIRLPTSPAVGSALRIGSMVRLQSVHGIFVCLKDIHAVFGLFRPMSCVKRFTMLSMPFLVGKVDTFF